VWPFSLINDGFWEKKIKNGWDERSEESYYILKSLCCAIMMRHSKQQKWIDGSELITLTDCNIQHTICSLLP
jgi:hypothetical protein